MALYATGDQVMITDSDIHPGETGHVMNVVDGNILDVRFPNGCRHGYHCDDVSPVPVVVSEQDKFSPLMLEMIDYMITLWGTPFLNLPVPAENQVLIADMRKLRQYVQERLA